MTDGKGEPMPETLPICIAGENWRVLEITILIARHAFHYGLGDSSTSTLLSFDNRVDNTDHMSKDLKVDRKRRAFNDD